MLDPTAVVVTVPPPVKVGLTVPPPVKVGLTGVIVVRDSGSVIADSPGSPSTTVFVTAPVGGQRVMALIGSDIVYADRAVRSSVLGFTANAVGGNSSVTIISSGDLDGFSGLTTGEFVYLGTNGVITQTPPTVGYLQILGVAVSSTKIIIQIQQPIFLG